MVICSLRQTYQAWVTRYSLVWHAQSHCACFSCSTSTNATNSKHQRTCSKWYPTQTPNPTNSTLASTPQRQASGAQLQQQPQTQQPARAWLTTTTLVHSSGPTLWLHQRPSGLQLADRATYVPQPHHQPTRSLHLAPPFLVEDYVPAAVTTHRLGRMPAKLQAARDELADCKACPRNCGVNRLENELGVCKVGRKALVSTVAPHFAEEAPVQGWRGSGTVFFSGCNLRCVFCQNWDISQQRAGFELTGPELADWMLRLQDEGHCHNINFVTPEHCAPQVAEAIASAVERGLTLPIIYNTSSYDALASLALMDGLVDIYLPDFKFWTADSSQRYAKARDYPERAMEAIKEMHRQVGDLVFSPDGLAKRGILLRHLVMPGLLDEGKAILNWVVSELGRDTYVHIMEQYVPRYLVGEGEQRSRGGWETYEEIKRRTDSEVQDLKAYARSIGMWRFEEMAQWETGELAG